VTEADFAMLLREVLMQAEETHNDEIGSTQYETEAEEDEALKGKVEFDVRTFEEAVLLTNNAGLIVKIGKREFQVTIVRSDAYQQEDEESDDSDE
jgi:hypothetical protein